MGNSRAPGEKRTAWPGFAVYMGVMGLKRRPEDLVQEVRDLVERRILTLGLPGAGPRVTDQLLPGKMLRTRLGARLASAFPSVDPSAVRRGCAAVEMVHTASLCHDDVIDNALMRRGCPALWKAVGTIGAVLIGDLLLAAAFELVARSGSARTGAFAEKLLEVAAAEAQQEFALRGGPVDESVCVELARGKTGPLFAFSAWVCTGDDSPRGRAQGEAGYLVGTAYQLADDLLDVVGSEEDAGKTLGTDAERGAPTLLNCPDGGEEAAARRIRALCASALAELAPWEGARRSLADFLLLDLQPVFDRCLPGLRVPTPEPTPRG